MATITKTAGIAILAHSAITHPDTLVGSAQDVSTKLAATILLFHASVEATANTNSGIFLVQVSGSASGDEDWVTVSPFQAMVSTADDEVMTAIEPVGEKVLAVTSTTGFVTGDKLYIQDIDTLANSEWNLCQEIVATPSINLVDGLTNEKSTGGSGCKIWNDADTFVCSLDLTAVSRVRVVFMHEGVAGANCHVKALMVTGDSIA